MADIATIMNLNPANIAQRQAEALEEHFKTVMAKVYEAFLRRDRKALEALVEFSAAGDGNGDDNHYIQFGWNNGRQHLRHEEASINNPHNLDILDLFEIYITCCEQGGMKIPCGLPENNPAKAMEKRGSHA